MSDRITGPPQNAGVGIGRHEATMEAGGAVVALLAYPVDQDDLSAAGEPKSVDAVTANDDELSWVGVAQVALAAGASGKFVFAGNIDITSGAAFADDAALTVNTAGKFITATTNSKIFAYARATASGADETIAVAFDGIRGFGFKGS